MAQAVKDAGPKTLRAYLNWHLLHTYVSQLPEAFVDADFAFYRQMLRGQQAPSPRWKRCVAVTDIALRDELGQAYVGTNFAGDSKSVALEMIMGIEAAFEAGLSSLSWMDDETRGRAVEKMNAIVNKIGYPDVWRDYAELEVGKTHLSNVLAAAKHEMRRSLSHYGKPVDKHEWHMSPPTVNAYYNPPMNEMVFPAGILQPPFFSADYPMAMNFGGIGMVMGHELTHGFDDSGRKFDGEGRLAEWWNATAVTKFEERAQCVDDLYSGYEVQPGLTLNGKLTLGENIADFGGIKQAHRAYLAWAQANAEDPAAPAIEGLTAEQLMFVAFGQIWCSKSTPEVDKVRAMTDPHSHPRYRINGPLSNLPAFWEAFSCEEGVPMHPPADAVCEVW
jgi:endothelin-converting enzyme/putative endopeptidase